MTPFLLFTPLFLLLPLPLPPASASPASGNASSNIDLKWWCDHTPHPKTCRHFLGPHVDPARPPRYRSDFYQLSVRVTYDFTLHAQAHLKNLSPRWRKSRRTRKAVLDCEKLYGHSLLQLNRTLNTPPRNCTPVDAQTWLSAALTNLKTCRKGFSDLKASYRALNPVMKYNVSELISNCLAINRPKNLTVSVPTTTLSTAANRKLLQTTAASTSFVVAKDGSGKYRTVQAAVNAADALRLSGYTRRIVIYVKAGVYNEIVTVASSLTGLTMAGDGRGKTIITGSRSVARGYTTFSSPTFSKHLTYIRE